MDDCRNKKLEEFALNQGFEKMYCVAPFKYDDWEKEMQGVGDDHGGWANSPDVFSQLEGIKSIVVLLSRHSPYAPFPRGYVHVPNYYVMTNKVIDRLRVVGDYIKNEYNANVLVNPKIPHRPTAIMAGAGKPGLNRLMMNESMGSYCHISLILTDADLEKTTKKHKEMCNKCGACVRACPTKALNMDGTWDYKKCLRHRISTNVFDEGIREHHQSLLGCERCMVACPVNKKQGELQQPTDDMVNLLAMEKLLNLENDVEYRRQLHGIFGKNVARGARMLNQSIMVCANMGWVEYKDQIRELISHENEITAELATWAYGKLCQR